MSDISLTSSKPARSRQDNEAGQLEIAIFRGLLRRRHSIGRRWQIIFLCATIVGIIALVVLFLNVMNEAFGMVAQQEAIPTASLEEQYGKALTEMSAQELGIILGDYARKGVLGKAIRDEIMKIDSAFDTSKPVQELLEGHNYPPQVADKPFTQMTESEMGEILGTNLNQERLYTMVMEKVVELEIVESWPLNMALFNREAIEAELAASDHPNAELKMHSWLNWEFLTKPMSATPALAGVRIALLGSLWILALTMVVAVPVGVGAAIYLEEYATDTWLNRLFETNIRNLAGVPSIIYGMLGLAIFVRTLGEFTSGAMFGTADSNGRTIISASFTLALLILPIIIINAQEAIRAVPWSIREASYGLGATKWQTIWRQVLPVGLPGILTGTILSLSRAIGETAPLIVVGASAVIFVNPDGPFSKFTALPIQIWQWTARPQDQFRDIAAAAIIVLLVMLLTLNATAIILRQRFSRRF